MTVIDFPNASHRRRALRQTRVRKNMQTFLFRSYDLIVESDEADWRLATTPPTTLAGVAAVLRFANEIEEGGMEWPNTDAVGPEGWHYQLRATMAAAIEALIKAQAGKAVA